MKLSSCLVLLLASLAGAPALAADTAAAAPYRFEINLDNPLACDVSVEDSRSGARFGVVVFLAGESNESEYENGDTGQKLQVRIERNAVGGSSCTAMMFEGGAEVARESKAN